MLLIGASTPVGKVSIPPVRFMLKPCPAAISSHTSDRNDVRDALQLEPLRAQIGMPVDQFTADGANPTREAFAEHSLGAAVVIPLGVNAIERPGADPSSIRRWQVQAGIPSRTDEPSSSKGIKGGDLPTMRSLPQPHQQPDPIRFPLEGSNR